MAGWTDDELRRIDSAQELEIAPVSRDGGPRERRPIWVVRARATISTCARPTDHAAAGTAPPGRAVRRGSGPAASRDVTVEDADDAVLEAVDEAYREKLASHHVYLRGVPRAEAAPASPNGPVSSRGPSRSGREIRFLIRDRDKKSTRDFDAIFASEGIRILKTPVRASTATQSANASPAVRTGSDPGGD